MLRKILNEIASTGKYPDEIKHGLLTPLQKPGKPKGPPENLRPVILLSTLPKILAICVIHRIRAKVDENILPATQAAYSAGRNTTELVFTFKVLAEIMSSRNLTATAVFFGGTNTCLLYTSPSPRDGATSRMPSSA